MRVRNVGYALASGLRYLDEHGIKEKSRNGPVTVAPGPVVTVTERPMERVLFSVLRDANPFFHLFESLWMLAGSNDLEWLSQFNKRMANFSDDGGTTQPGAYGYRWRKHFSYDQLEMIVDQLSNDPNSRRAVLTMWDGGPSGFGDLGAVARGTADVPCNTHIYFRVSKGRLHMTVLCRSNDLLWGAHGANAVHFSVLQEYIAERLELLVGEMIQFSNNYHLYDDVLKYPSRQVRIDAKNSNAYSKRPDQLCGMIYGRPRQFENDCIDLVKNGKTEGFFHPFFIGTVKPMLRAWAHHKSKNYSAALSVLEEPGIDLGWDWRLDARNWIMRRKKAHDEKSR
jgi:thymidylate synthase